VKAIFNDLLRFLAFPGNRRAFGRTRFSIALVTTHGLVTLQWRCQDCAGVALEVGG
jgi:hypothetical protein